MLPMIAAWRRVEGMYCFYPENGDEPERQKRRNLPACRRVGPIDQTMTGAITVTLRERLEREKHERSVAARVQEMRAIRDRCAKLMGPSPSAVNHGDVLYDERGLPK